MPVPGPRIQQRSLPGYNNPDIQPRRGAGESHRWTPLTLVGKEIPGRRFNQWHRPAPVADMGESPGLMYISLRGNVLGFGQIRRFWRQAVGYIPAPAPYSWTASAPRPGEPGMDHPALGVTRALRYMTRSISLRAGEDNTRFAGLHTQIVPKSRQPTPTLGAGLVRSRPTVRNRMTSFGARVPAINKSVQAAADTKKGAQGG